MSTKPARSLWFFVLLTTGIWHLGRGAFGDATIFLIASLLLELDFRNIRLLIKNRISVAPLGIAAGSIVAWVTLTFSPRWGWPDIATLFTVGALAFLNIWHPDYGRKPQITAAQKVAIRIWTWLLIALSVVELSAFVLATMHKSDDFNYPTISVVLDPSLDSVIGRGIFSAVWLTFGYFLVRPRVDLENAK